MLTRLRDALDRFIHHGITELVIIVLILLSIAMMVGEFVASSEAQYRALRFGGDTITGVFVVELLIRFWVAPKKRRFFERYWIDILAVIPLIRVFRVFRVFQVFRLYRAGILIHRRMSGFAGPARRTTTCRRPG